MQCPWCASGRKRLWYGWLFGKNDVKGGSALLQLTATAVRSSLSLRDSAQDLRGAKIELFRQQDRTGSTVLAQVTLSRTPERYHADQPDTLAHLFQFYGIVLPQLVGFADEQGGEP